MRGAQGAVRSAAPSCILGVQIGFFGANIDRKTDRQACTVGLRMALKLSLSLSLGTMLTFPR